MDRRLHEYAEWLTIMFSVTLVLLQPPVKGNKMSGKMPIKPKWNKSKTNLSTLYNWMSQDSFSNIGMATGSVSGFLVVDIDGDEGLALYKKVSQQVGFDTVTVKTPSGGYHLYYKIPEEYRGFKFEKKIFKGKQDHNECAFLGDGHQIVLPYSTHHTGKIYDFLEGYSPAETEFNDAPPYMIEMMINREANNESSTKSA